MTSIANAGGGASATLTLPLQITVSLGAKKKLLLWGNIENHIAKEATHVESKKVSIFNGPVFRQNDRKHRGLQIPREYWKIVVFRNDQNQPRALAFILSQAGLIKTLPTEDFMVGPYEVYQVKVRELELKTKLDFGDLRTFDPLEDNTNEHSSKPPLKPWSWLTCVASFFKASPPYAYSRGFTACEAGVSIKPGAQAPGIVASWFVSP